MKRTITFTIHGDPTPLARPRFSQKSRKVYDHQAAQKLIAAHAMQEELESNFEQLQGPLKLTITCFMAIPEFLSMKKKKEKLGSYHTNKPDLSNMIKFYEDLGNTLIYHDDSYISVIESKKIYDYDPRTEITIEELL